MEELKPCPSGHKAYLIQRKKGGLYAIGCEFENDCYFSTCLDSLCDNCSDGWVKKEDAIEKWNTRAKE